MTLQKKRFVIGNREQLAWIFPSGLLIFLWRKSFRGSLGQVIGFISKKDCFLVFMKIPATYCPNERFLAT